MRNWNFRKCKMYILEIAEAAPCLPTSRKSCKPISRNHTWKRAHCLEFQGAHEVKESIVWEPLRYTTCLSLCSNSQGWGSAGAHDQGNSMWQHGLVTTGRSGDLLMVCQGCCCLLWWSQEINMFVQSISVNSQIVWPHLVPSVPSVYTIQNGMGWIHTCWNTLQLTPRTYC